MSKQKRQRSLERHKGEVPRVNENPNWNLLSARGMHPQYCCAHKVFIYPRLVWNINFLLWTYLWTLLVSLSLVCRISNEGNNGLWKELFWDGERSRSLWISRHVDNLIDVKSLVIRVKSEPSLIDGPLLHGKLKFRLVWNLYIPTC